ncbi:MAG: RecQ family ATP-dependent DNA helicase, partial [Verrucomicrobiae bacterium]|nr:RecQ family ATP-dependent DNA helicase [Verrucomicrobiae bacterium]NNJ87016.1 ATP-dependent DNA helicase RecQ [Akkermansiaceae bacterium]
MERQRDKILKSYFGHDELRSGQADVIEQVLDGVNTLAVLPTGGGKSLCYQLPALCMDGLTIVVSPLIALMRDQVEALLKKGVSAVRLDSSAPEESRDAAYQLMEAGELKLLYVSPERLADSALLKILKAQTISLVAIDEAHCISEWGHSFRPSYIKLPRLVRSLKPAVILALTATASKRSAAGIRKAFKIRKMDQVQTSFFRQNLAFDISVCRAEEKKSILLGSLAQTGRSPAIVYATRRGDVEELVAFLTKAGVPARAYHAGMPADARAEVQDGFLGKKFPVICATIAFGMGVDMPDVRSVIHYHPPKSPEGWIQESGRAGRDGNPSHCEILINGNDRLALEGMIVAKQPGRRAVEAILQNLFSQGKRAIISRYNLSTLNDIPGDLLDVLLARLETAGWITPDGGSWMWCHVVPLRWDAAARARMLSGFSKKEQSILTKLIDSKQRVSLLDLADHQVSKMNRLVNLLREMESAGEVKLRMSHSLVHYRIKKEPQQLATLIDEALETFQEHANHDLTRIDAVFKIATSRKCIAASLVGYFGEKLADPCGRCASCKGKYRTRKLPVSDVGEITLDELEQIQSIV